MKYITALLFVFLPSALFAHARMTFPQPRNNNAGIKSGPCGGLARSATPTNVVGGQMLTVTWQETINHPGRYIFSLSFANDLGFAQNILATIPDVQNGGGLPHMYTAQIPIPNVNCSTCTIQLIQSMEENPAAPTYYYSCADINITQAAVTPPVVPPTPPVTPTPPIDDGGVVIQSSSTPEKSFADFGGGCGIVKSIQAASQNGPNYWLLLLGLLPIFTWLGLFISLQPRRQSN